MKHCLSDWVWGTSHSHNAARGFAALILFVVHPGGFEGQVGWLVALMPGAIVGLPFADGVQRIAPSAERFAHWATVISVSLLWYFAITCAAIAAYRFIVRRWLA